MRERYLRVDNSQYMVWRHNFLGNRIDSNRKSECTSFNRYSPRSTPFSAPLSYALPTEGSRLSPPKHFSMGAQPVPKIALLTLKCFECNGILDMIAWLVSVCDRSAQFIVGKYRHFDKTFDSCSDVTLKVRFTPSCFTNVSVKHQRFSRHLSHCSKLSSTFKMVDGHNSETKFLAVI